MVRLVKPSIAVPAPQGDFVPRAPLRSLPFPSLTCGDLLRSNLALRRSHIQRAQAYAEDLPEDCLPKADGEFASVGDEKKQSFTQAVVGLFRERDVDMKKLGAFVFFASLFCLGLTIVGPAQASAQAAETTNFFPINLAKGFVSFVLHLDVHLGQIIARYGNATYAILFAIVFCETGLVITPFLPGDSLLFAAGAFASLGHLSVPVLLATFISSAILGDFVNYQLGKYFGNKAKDSKLVERKYLEKTEAFYEKYGGKTVVLARFIPIVRTFAPFVAGVGAMSYQRFSLYNIGGAVLWSVLFVGAGSWLGNIPAVKHNFSIVIFAIIGVSLLPVLIETVVTRKEVRAVGADPRNPEDNQLA